MQVWLIGANRKGMEMDGGYTNVNEKMTLYACYMGAGHAIHLHAGPLNSGPTVCRTKAKAKLHSTYFHQGNLCEYCRSWLKRGGWAVGREGQVTVEVNRQVPEE